MRGETDHRCVADNPANVRGRQILLPNVNARGARQPRDVRAVVDDDHGIARASQLNHSRREVEEFCTSRLLGANLQKASATAQVRGSQIHRRPACARRDVDVDDGVQRENLEAQVSGLRDDFRLQS